MSRFFTILIFGLLSALSIQARETVTGLVVSDKGEPMPGVRVEVPGSSDFVFTDLDGRFQIVLKDPTKNLTFTYPGLGTSTYKVKPEMNVVLGKGWSGHEKGFRGMIDLEGGMGVGGNTTIKSGEYEWKNIHTLVSPGLSIILGYQINRHLFAGLGFGVNMEWISLEGKEPSYSWLDTRYVGGYTPVYLTARWDFGLTKKTAPYIDLRIGCAPFLEDDGELPYLGYWPSYLRVYKDNCVSFFVAPAIGYHVNIHKKFGLNFGLRYMTGMKKKYNVEREWSDPITHEVHINSKNISQHASDIIMFNIGFDF